MPSRRFYLSFLVFAASAFSLIFVAGCAVKRHSLSVLTARNPSQHHLIDDFRTGKLVNKVGGAWTEAATAGATLSTDFVREDAIKPHGVALKVEFSLPARGEVSLVSDLNQLDISQARALSFWIKAKSNFEQVLFVGLANEYGESIEIPLDGYLSSGEDWQEVLFTEEKLRGIKLFGMKTFRLTVRSGEKPISGTFLLDHLTFSGEPSLRLRSLADNLYGYSAQMKDENRRLGLAKLYDERMLEGIARDTWKYFRDLVDRENHLPVDHVKMDHVAQVGDYCSPTNVGMYFLACISAVDFKLLTPSEAEERIAATLSVLRRLPRWRGFFYNYYNTTNLQITNRLVSSVDNAWLAASLVVVRQTFPSLAAEASAFIDEMDFAFLYDENIGQFHIGYDSEQEALTEHHYGLLASETRIVSYIAIGKGDVEDRHWFRLNRTLPKEWDWQKQTPRGESVTLLGQPLFQGYYVYHDIPIVPSWGGALFEFLMPTLLVDELGLAPKGLGANDRNAVLAHIEYATQERNYGVWGISSCAFTNGANGGYGEFGVPEIGTKGYADSAVITPHVSFLALAAQPQEAINNIRAFLNKYPMYGPYGLYDSVDVEEEKVCYQYLALDQGMTLVALNNFLNDNAIVKRFHADPVGARIEPLLVVEEFYPGFKSK